MKFSIDIQFRSDGRFEANCQELGLSAVGETIEQALTEMGSLLMYHVSGSVEAEGSYADEEEVVKQLHLAFKNRNFHMPRNPKIH